MTFGAAVDVMLRGGKGRKCSWPDGQWIVGPDFECVLNGKGLHWRCVNKGATHNPVYWVPHSTECITGEWEAEEKSSVEPNPTDCECGHGRHWHVFAGLTPWCSRSGCHCEEYTVTDE